MSSFGTTGIKRGGGGGEAGRSDVQEKRVAGGRGGGRGSGSGDGQEGWWQGRGGGGGGGGGDEAELSDLPENRLSRVLGSWRRECG